MYLNSSEFVSISWITAFNRDQEDWETDFFLHIQTMPTLQAELQVEAFHWALHYHTVELSQWKQ